jgi:glycosyltransferase involved in cell wall biosynthesis
MRIAIFGTRGVPARHGGFETAVEEIGARLVKQGHEVIVYCRNPKQASREHLGMTLVNLPAIRTRYLETASHTALSVAHGMIRLRPDVALVFNAGNAPLVPVLRLSGVPVAVHVDGLEWRRAKWTGLGARYYRWAEQASVRWADEVISDAQAIRSNVHETYGRDSTFLAYGAPIVSPGTDLLTAAGLTPGGYHLVVARFEPENHVVEAVQAYARSRRGVPLVVVGSAPYSDSYVAAVHAAAQGDPRVRFLGSVWNQALLDQLYAHALTYIHGHSVGGTNPSLLRAMGAAAPIVAFDVGFNREVCGDTALFYDGPEALTRLLETAEADPTQGRERAAAARDRAAELYTWDEVANGYEALAQRLLAASRRRRRRRRA